jgi:hypothetical protein
LVEVPLVDGEPDPDLKIDGFVILENADLDTFVEQQDFAADQTIGLFTAGCPGRPKIQDSLSKQSCN